MTKPQPIIQKEMPKAYVLRVANTHSVALHYILCPTVTYVLGVVQIPDEIQRLKSAGYEVVVKNVPIEKLVGEEYARRFRELNDLERENYIEKKATCY